jgi:hypothetical protein
MLYKHVVLNCRLQNSISVVQLPRIIDMGIQNSEVNNPSGVNICKIEYG